ncbi:MAG TPA: SDR family oxidoreductase [Polyangiaceae bacterium]|nr:SDR family oxidoreductase [Polyangiaceae bacterium]
MSGAPSPAMAYRSPMFAPGLFEGQAVLVTGGGTGIGLAAAREFAALGARVAIASRSAEKLAAGAAALAADGAEPFARACDIRDAAACEGLVDAVLGRFGRLDVLVNNAGGQFPAPAALTSPKGFEAVVRNNLNGTFYMTLAAATRALLPARRGRVVNVIANVARGFPGMAHTGAARAGVENLTKSLAVEWAPSGVRVNAVAPGNNIASSGTAQYGEALLDAARRATPLKRLGTPEEVARVIVFLASDLCDFVTGCTYYVDGGQALWGDIWPIDDPAPAPAGPGDAP